MFFSARASHGMNRRFLLMETQGNELLEGMLYNPPNRYSLFRNLLIACLFVLHEIETHGVYDRTRYSVILQEDVNRTCYASGKGQGREQRAGNGVAVWVVAGTTPAAVTNSEHYWQSPLRRLGRQQCTWLSGCTSTD